MWYSHDLAINHSASLFRPGTDRRACVELRCKVIFDVIESSTIRRLNRESWNDESSFVRLEPHAVFAVERTVVRSVTLNLANFNEVAK